MKEILYGRVAREKIKEGIDTCVDVVKVSMGKNGKNVLIYNGQQTEIINDGVSIARQVDVKDEGQQAGIRLAKQCAAQTNTEVGDGTTTTLVLLQALLNEIVSPTQLVKPRELRTQIQEATNEVLEELKKIARPVETEKDLEFVATTSSLDPKIGKMIAEIYWKLGKDANITIEEAPEEQLSYEIVPGYQFDSINVALYSEEKEEYEDIPLYVTKKPVTGDELLKKITVLAQEGQDHLLVIAPQWKKDALSIITGFKMKGTFTVAAVQNKEVNEDDLMSLGNKISKAIITSETTTLIGGNDNSGLHIQKLEEQVKKEESAFKKEQIKKRISELTGGVAVITVGKNTDVERNEIMLKVEDAIKGTKSSYALGVAEGAGHALKLAAICLPVESGTEGDRIIWEVCQSPYRQLCLNSEADSIPEDKTVLDSVAVITSALKNAVSTATSICTVEAMLIEKSDE